MATPTDPNLVLSIRLPTDVAVALKSYSFLTSTSINAVVKTAVVEYLQGHRGEMTDAAFDRVVEQHREALKSLEAL